MEGVREEQREIHPAARAGRRFLAFWVCDAGAGSGGAGKGGAEEFEERVDGDGEMERVDGEERQRGEGKRHSRRFFWAVYCIEGWG
jgi:hypothetical protein